MLVSATRLNMPSLLLILMFGLLLPQGVSCVGRAPKATPKPFHDRSANARAMYLKRKLDFIGCYNATFHFSKVVPANGKDCKVVCKAFEKASSPTLRRLRRLSNVCLVDQDPYKVEHEAVTLQDGDLVNICSPEVCACKMRLDMKDILLSPSQKSRRSHQGIRRVKAKSDTSDPSPSVGLESFGSNMSPNNCNASTFASWLALKLELRTSDATFSDVKFDPKCEAFTKFAGPLEPRGDVEAEYDTLRKEIREQRKARKTEIASQQSHHKMPKRQRTEEGSCSAPRYSLPDLNLPAPESETELFDDSRQDLGPAGAAQAATQPRELLQEMLSEEATMWEKHFPGAIAIAQQDDDGDQGNMAGFEG